MVMRDCPRPQPGLASLSLSFERFPNFVPSLKTAIDQVSEQFPAFSDLVSIPLFPILFRQGNELSVRAGARRAPGMRQQHERQQAYDLAVARKKGKQEPR